MISGGAADPVLVDLISTGVYATGSARLTIETGAHGSAHGAVRLAAPGAAVETTNQPFRRSDRIDPKTLADWLGRLWEDADRMAAAVDHVR